MPAAMKLLDSMSSPGSKLEGGLKSGAGDDHYAFDEGGGWACVIDGATDVGPIRVFEHAESDAARFAELFAATLVAHPPGADEAVAAYAPRLAAELARAAEADARFPLETAPLSSLPTAAATLVHIRNGLADALTLGDTVAILRRPDGSIDVLGDAAKPAEESQRARRVMQMTGADRMKWLQDTRELHNRPNGYWIFGVQPEAVEHAVCQFAPCPPGGVLLLMTDGFYRLVSPYGRYDDAALIEAARAKGLGPLLTELRSLESNPGDDVRLGRFKTSDDATALLFEV